MGRSGLSTGALLHCQVAVVGRGGSAQLGVGELSGCGYLRRKRRSGAATGCRLGCRWLGGRGVVAGGGCARHRVALVDFK
jgi:hypothetical protein